ncbi:hypothetical protein HDU98_012283 [Podochytrium sp. JEL0797]|nr:hypothetical protein HDU98_012283 [Podochytrium sp. JEL0797]
MANISVHIDVDPQAQDCDILKLFPDPADAVREGIALVLSVLYESSDEYPPVTHLRVQILPFDGCADTSGSKTNKLLRLNSSYFTFSRHADLRHEVMGVIVHELTHVLQYDGSIDGRGGTANGGFIEGLADFVRIQCGLGLDPGCWRREVDPPKKDQRRWDCGYEHTAYFLRFIEKTYPHFAKRMNLLLRDCEWDDALFQALTTVPLQQLWKSYLDSFGVVMDDGPVVERTDASGWPAPHLAFENRVEAGVENPFLKVWQSVGEAVMLLGRLSGVVLGALYVTGRKKEEEGAPPTHLQSIRLVVREMDGVAHCTGSREDKEIHVSAEYLRTVEKREGVEGLRKEVEGVLVHELTHVWQHSCEGFPGGLLEGVADWVRLTTGHAPVHWKRGREGRWDAGYAKTAYFLEWIDVNFLGNEKGEFVRGLNGAVKGGEKWHKLMVFEKLTGKGVDELWALYCGEEEVTPEVAERIRKENVVLVEDLKRLLAVVESPESGPEILRKVKSLVGGSVAKCLKEL